MWHCVRLAWLSTAIVVLATPAAHADDAGAPTGEDGQLSTTTDGGVEYGVGIRLRGVFVPKGELELFVERAGDNGSSQLGLGVELTRRRGDTELQLGIEFEGFNPGEGVWIENGDDVALGDSADVVLARGDQPDPLSWVTFEFTFFKNTPLTKQLALRFGVGGGLGIVTGELRHYDVFCAPGATNDNPSPGCEPPVPPFNGTGQFENGEVLVPYDLPPVFPVLNAIAGLQIKPTEKMTINVEGGIRTFLFFGVSSSYFF